MGSEVRKKGKAGRDGGGGEDGRSEEGRPGRKLRTAFGVLLAHKSVRASETMMSKRCLMSPLLQGLNGSLDQQLTN
jgi:hypothetical protein